MDQTKIYTVARVRPCTPQEAVLEVDPPNHQVSLSSERFSFDAVLPLHCCQQSVHQTVGKRILRNCRAGLNSTVFAYGQTGSGKTYTMTGNDHQLGLVQLTLNQLNEQHLQLSYFQIYKQQIIDLLGEGNRLKLRQSPAGVFVSGLKSVAASSASQALELVSTAISIRHSGFTAVNSNSSRSHSVLTLQLDDGPKVHFVDLAGSQRQKAARTGGSRLQEAACINRSLSLLSHVITALGQPGRTHVPFRDSKLTYFLKDSLCGQSKAIMIFTLSNAPQHYFQTLSTLRFAQRAKLVPARIKEELLCRVRPQQLQLQLVQLKQKLRQIQSQEKRTVAELDLLKEQNTHLAEDKLMLLKEVSQLSQQVYQLNSREDDFNEQVSLYQSGLRHLEEALAAQKRKRSRAEQNGGLQLRKLRQFYRSLKSSLAELESQQPSPPLAPAASQTASNDQRSFE